MNTETIITSDGPVERIENEESLLSKGLACIAYAVGLTGFAIMPAVVIEVWQRLLW